MIKFATYFELTEVFFIKTLKKILIGIIIGIVALQVTFYIALQFPGVQTRIVKGVINSLQENINGKINIDKIYIIFFNRVILKNVSIVSTDTSPLLDSLKTFHHQSDTLVSCEKISVSISPAELLKLNFRLTSLNLENGVFNLQNEAEGSSNLSRIFRSKNKKQKDTSTAKKPLDLNVNSLRVKNFRFTLNNPAKFTDKGDSTLNFADLDVRNIHIDINHIRFNNDTIFAQVNNIAGEDKSGFRLKTLACNLELSGTQALLNNLILADGYSNITAGYFSMKYDSPKDLSDFTRKVVMGIDLQDAYLNFKTIGKIAPALHNSSLSFFATGEVTGTVSNLRTGSLKVTSESGQTYMDIETRLMGLPDIKETMIIAEINHCYTTTNDIAAIISSIKNTPQSPFFKTLPPLVQYNFTGGFSGLLDDFVADGEIYSALGSVKLDMLFRTGKELQGILLKGEVKTTDLNLGKLLSKKLLGELTMQSRFTAALRNENSGGTEISIDSVRINKLGLNGYNYSNIYALGKYTSNDFDGRIICHDPNLDFIFQGLLSFNQKEDSKYNFYLDVPYANLAAMNIDKRDTISEVNIMATANYVQTPQGDIFGSIDIKNSGYINSKGSFNLGSIKLTSHESDSNFNSLLTSPFIKAKFQGTAPVTSFIKKFTAITLYSRFNNYLDKDVAGIMAKKEEYKFSAETYNTRGICEFLLPGLYIQDSTQLNVTINPDNDLKMSVRSGRLAIGQNYLKDLDLRLKNDTASVTSRNIQIAGISLDSLFIGMKGKENLLNTTLRFNSDSVLNNHTLLNTSVAFFRDTITIEKPVYAKGKLSSRKTLSQEIKKWIKININRSDISFKGEAWKFSPSDITIADSTLTFNKLQLYNGGQNITVDGFLSKARQDSLAVTLNKFDIGILNLFLNKNFDIEGYFSGNGLFSTLENSPRLFLDLNGDSVYVYHNPVGKMKILSKWDTGEKRFNVLIHSKLKERSNLAVTGYYKPDSSYLDLNASLNDFSVSYFEPFLSDIISRTSGNLSGDIRLHGPLSQLELDGENCSFTDFDFTVNFTQVPYRLNGPVRLNKDGVNVNGVTIRDQYGSTGTLSGGLSYQYFKNISLNTRIDFYNLQCLDTREKDNEAFYGKAFATGHLLIKGPLNKLLLEANVDSDAKTSIHIPLSGAATANQTNLLTFTPPLSLREDPYELILKNNEPVKQPTELNVRLNVNVTPQAEIMIEINKSVGDIIKANGNGLINMDINPSKEVFDIFGNYTISQGSYKFVFMGFAPKYFTIQPGSNINFNGDITNTQLNLTAIYQTKASINTLIADTSSVSTRRTVDCELGMNGQLMNPELSFNIQIPDLDPTTKMRVESALNSTGKIQKQFMALLVSGGFIPDEQSGIANNSTLLYSNASEILSNQLNNVLQQLGIPLDLGLNYQPGQQGNDVFDVAVSTQLFNNRVIINGNIGNDPYASTNNRDVIGNLDIEIKLDKNGRLRLDLFSHAADKYSNYLDDKQRSGIGVVYQQEFNHIKDIFRRKTKEQKEYEKERKALDKEHRVREKAIEKAAREAMKMIME